MPTLSERLEANKEFVLGVATNHAHNTTPTKPTPISKINLYMAIHGGMDYTLAIRELNELRDQEAGIIWYEQINPADGSKVRIRDAREQGTEQVVHDDRHPFMVQYLNLLRAVEDLTKTQPLKDDYKYLTAQLVGEILYSKNPKKTIESYKKKLAVQLAKDLNGIESEPSENQVEAVSKQLNVAMNFAGLRDEHPHIVTLTSDGGNPESAIMQADVAILGLSEEQKAEYITTGTKSDDEKIRLINALGLSKEQKLVYVSKEMGGRRITPERYRAPLITH